MTVKSIVVSPKSFWRRRVIEPLAAQLKQGATPEKLAQSMAWGFTLGIFPILGTPSILCGIAGVVLRLNHIAIQTVNWLVYPLQIVLIIPFLKLGNRLFGFGELNLSLKEIALMFEQDFGHAALELGGLALRGIVAWVLVALPLNFVLRRILLPPIRHLAVKVFPKSTHL